MELHVITIQILFKLVYFRDLLYFLRGVVKESSENKKKLMRIKIAKLGLIFKDNVNQIYSIAYNKIKKKVLYQILREEFRANKELKYEHLLYFIEERTQTKLTPNYFKKSFLVALKEKILSENFRKISQFNHLKNLIHCQKLFLKKNFHNFKLLGTLIFRKKQK